MEAILIKNVPPDLKRRLRLEAERNRRSMNQQALVILERGLPKPLPRTLPSPVEPLRKLTAAMLRRGIRQGRE